MADAFTALVELCWSELVRNVGGIVVASDFINAGEARIDCRLVHDFERKQRAGVAVEVDLEAV